MSNKAYSIKDIKNVYKEQKKLVFDPTTNPPPVNAKSVFANNEMSLRHIDVYGFDYDYTLAVYDDELDNLIYNLAVSNLVTMYRYPKEIINIPYNREFPIRGLHYDVFKGLLMKLDSCSHLQLGTVYRGLKQVDDWEVLDIYKGTLVPADSTSKGIPKKGQNILHHMDAFALPFLSLLANVTQYLVDNDVSYDPEYIYHDIEDATQEVHRSGKMHRLIVEDPDRYIPKNPAMLEYLESLLRANKKLFLMTNSGYDFVNKGMTHLFGNDWQDIFDVTVTNSRKPKFFSNHKRPFRSIDPKTGQKQWDTVKGFTKNGIYHEGNISEFMQFTNYRSQNVLYFGDHVYSDLMDVTTRHGWRTGAIISELEREVSITNEQSYINGIQWMFVLEELITFVQEIEDPEAKDFIRSLKDERKEIRKQTKVMFNPNFGSTFRTYNNSTQFCRRLTRYADIYTSSLENLMNYNLEYTFYPRRQALPHEINFTSPHQQWRN